MKPVIIEQPPEDAKVVVIGDDGKRVDLQLGQNVGSFVVGDDKCLELDIRMSLVVGNPKYSEFYHEFEALLKKYKDSHVVRYISGMR